MAVDAIVLAGGAADAVSALEPGAPTKAFVRIAGVALVQRTITGLLASSRIDRLVAVAPHSFDTPSGKGPQEHTEHDEAACDPHHGRAVLLLGQHDLLWPKLLPPLATLRRLRKGDLLRAGPGRLRRWMLLFGKQLHRQRYYLLRWRDDLRRPMLPQWFALQY